MSDANDTIPAGQVRFFDSYQPGLQDGRYRLTVAQTVDAAGATIPDLTQEFAVAGPRFTLAPGDIHVEFPPNGSSSQFEDVLAHVVLTKRLLPWERDVPSLPRTVPWLALLILQESELIGYTGSGSGAQTMTVAQLRRSGSATVRVPQIPDDALRPARIGDCCQVITLSAVIFAQNHANRP